MNQSVHHWRDVLKEDLRRDNFEIRVNMEVACKIKSLSFECMQTGVMDEVKWQEGIADILGYHLPQMLPGEEYKLVIV